jgi:hypothetical protein
MKHTNTRLRVYTGTATEKRRSGPRRFLLGTLRAAWFSLKVLIYAGIWTWFFLVQEIDGALAALAREPPRESFPFHARFKAWAWKVLFGSGGKVSQTTTREGSRTTGGPYR